MAGIKETKELVTCILDFMEGIAVSLDNDGEITWTDAINFVSALKSMPRAFDGISEIPTEVGDLTENEVKELVEYVMEEFDIPQDQVENMIERALGIGFAVYDYVVDLQNIFSQEVT